MKFKIDRIISIAMLLASVVTLILVLKKPAPVAQPQSATAIAANAQSFDQKIAELERATRPAPAGVFTPSATVTDPNTASKYEVRLSSDEVGAVLAQASGLAGSLTPDSNVGEGAPAIKDQRVSFEGDEVHGQFLTEIAGKEVWVTVSGRLGSRDGYATFDPTEFKVGDLSVPVSLVNPALQKKLSEQRDRLKLPDFVGDVKVQNGELVMQQK